MRRYLLLLAALLALLSQSAAQDTLGRFRNSIRIDLLPAVYMSAPYFSYERGLGRSISVEANAYGRKELNCSMLQIPTSSLGGEMGIKVMPLTYRNSDFFSLVFYPIAFPLAVLKLTGLIKSPPPNEHLSERKEMKCEGYLVSGMYVKAGLTYLCQWRTYDCFAEFRDGTIITEDRTFHGQQLGMTIALGQQWVGRKGFIYEEYAGLHIPLACDIVHNYITPGYLGLFTIGIRLGWGF